MKDKLVIKYFDIINELPYRELKVGGRMNIGNNTYQLVIIVNDDNDRILYYIGNRLKKLKKEMEEMFPYKFFFTLDQY
jgi:hypothetical protein